MKVLFYWEMLLPVRLISHSFLRVAIFAAWGRANRPIQHSSNLPTTGIKLSLGYASLLVIF
jgi:hypothetical protein